jgi:hypothetical protein
MSTHEGAARRLRSRLRRKRLLDRRIDQPKARGQEAPSKKVRLSSMALNDVFLHKNRQSLFSYQFATHHL